MSSECYSPREIWVYTSLSIDEVVSYSFLLNFAAKDCSKFIMVSFLYYASGNLWRSFINFFMFMNIYRLLIYQIKIWYNYYVGINPALQCLHCSSMISLWISFLYVSCLKRLTFCSYVQFFTSFFFSQFPAVAFVTFLEASRISYFFCILPKFSLFPSDDIFHLSVCLLLLLIFFFTCFGHLIENMLQRCPREL